MSFQSKNFWMPRDVGCLSDGDISFDTTSKVEPKRAHHWFMDASESELFCNKKQAVVVSSSRPISGIPNANISIWENNLSFQSVPEQFTDRLFGSETLRTSNLLDRSIRAVSTGNSNMERKGFEDQFECDFSVGLSVSHTMEDPSLFLNCGGIIKAKFNQVRDSENGISISIGHSYGRGDNDPISIGIAHNKADGNIISGQTFNGGNESTTSMGPTFNKVDDDFLSMGNTFNKGDGNFVFMGQNINKGDANILSMGQPFDKGNGGFLSMGHRYEMGNGNIISVGHTNSRGQENLDPMSSAYNKTNEKFITIGPSHVKDDGNNASIGPTSNKADTTNVSMATTYDEGSSILSMGQNYNQDESTTIAFGGLEEEAETNPSGGIISGYDLLTSQPSAQTFKALGQEDSIEYNTGALASVSPAATSKTNAALKNKEQKQSKNAPPNNFPSNVKSLLSTGILDGVPVKYVSWSREKNLKGIIKGTGYLCGCNDCNFSKALNAYEFERHAGCKTKHPNNHIYFENGKTIYGVVQELKTTTQEILFEAIQNVTGSPINQKNFRSWKASYQAATRELQRIYGKEEVIMLS